MSPIRVLAERHRQHLQARNYSECTLRNRDSHLRHFFRFLRTQRIKQLEEIDPEALRKYQIWLSRLPTNTGRIRTPATLNRNLTSVRVLFRFLYETGHLQSNPSRELVYAREPQPLPHAVLTPDEAKSVIESVDTLRPSGYRDRAILEVLYATGIRKSELTHLKIEDVNFEDMLLTVRHGKGNTDRVVPLGPIGCRCVANYIKCIRPLFVKGADSGYVFLSCFGRPMSATAIASLVQYHAARAGVRSHMTCHQWRHTCATHMVQNGANLRHVQEMLGHHDLTTTERYLHLTILDLKEAHRKHHPREKEIALRQKRGQNTLHAGNTLSTNGPAERAETCAFSSQQTTPSACDDRKICTPS